MNVLAEEHCGSKYLLYNAIKSFLKLGNRCLDLVQNGASDFWRADDKEIRVGRELLAGRTLEAPPRDRVDAAPVVGWQLPRKIMLSGRTFHDGG